MNQYKSLLAVFALIAIVFCQNANGHRRNNPNIVIVITDDQGYGDLGCHGNPILKTPNLDSLYAQSIRLTDYHVSPTCAPTRSSLQSGHWANRTGVWHTIMGRSLIREGEPTIGEVFSNAGYATGMFGKWHLGDNYPFRPEDRGYQEVLRHGGGGIGQTPDYWDNAYFNDTYFHNGKPTKFEGYCTDIFFSEAKKFIKTQTDAGKPFVAYISTNTPHGPQHAPQASADKYVDLKDLKEQHFFGMIDNIDTNVGQLRQFLADENLTENTIFVFTTDNGTASGDRIFSAGMRGKKGSKYDGGHRVPFFLHWPGGGLDRPKDIKTVTHAVDVLPTLLELCQIEPVGPLDFDGLSLVSLLNGKPDSTVDWNGRVLITDSQRVKEPVMWKDSCVMTSQWRLIDGEELYDIQADPSQKRDLATAFPAEVRQLRAEYQTWWEEISPSFKDIPLVVIGTEAESPTTLTSHDWETENVTPWNQKLIRLGEARPENTGFWNVKIADAGKYRFQLRRWPQESNTAINDWLPAGSKVPGVAAMRTTRGKQFDFVSASLKVGDEKHDVKLDANALEATFDLELAAGKTKIEARFIDQQKNAVGAYYVYVQKVD